MVFLKTRRFEKYGKNGAASGAQVRSHTNSDVPRQHSRQSTRLEEKCLPNPDVPRSNRPTNTTIATNQPFLPRSVNAAQNTGAETRPNMQRMATAQSVKECSCDVPMKVAENPPQLDTVVPGSALRKDNTRNSGNKHDELTRNYVAAIKDREQELVNVIEDHKEHIQKRDVRIQDLLNVQSNYISEISVLKAQLQEEQGQVAKLTQAWRRSTTALSQAQRQEANYKVDDKALEGQYQEIVYNVANWAGNYCVADMKQLSNAEFEPFLSLTIVPEKYLHHRITQPLLLKSLVMKMLVDDIFTVSTENQSGMWWAGNRAQEMRSMYNTLMPAEPDAIPVLLKKGALRSADAKDFSQWKAKSALLLSQREEPSFIDSSIEMLVRKWKQRLTPFVERNDARVWRELGDVIGKAINLDLEMSKSRALFTVHRWSAEELDELDQTRLQAAEGFKTAQPGMTVELVLAPSLTKTGSADGDAFEAKSFISNWLIVSTEHRENML